MNFNEYQEAIKAFSVYPGHQDINDDIVPYSSMMYPALGLAEEAGEVCGKIAKAIRKNDAYPSQEERTRIALELGDVLFMVARLASHINYNLEAIAGGNVGKLLVRKENGKIVGEGDIR